MDQNIDVCGRVAVITGGASGIGLGLALRAAHEGMDVALADVEEEPLVQALKQIEATGVRAIAVRTDVSDPTQMRRLSDQVEQRLGVPWLLCNNAGVNKFKKLWEYSAAEWRWILGVDLQGVINGISAFVPDMVSRNAGFVVNTASAAGLYATPGSAPYSTAKHAVVGLSECLWRELQLINSSVGVSVLCPKLVATNMSNATRNEPGTRRTADTATPSQPKAPLMDVLTPAAIADGVFDAIRCRKFWILPHAQTMRETVLHRFEQAILGINPDDRSEDRLSTLLSGRRAGLLPVA